MRVSLFLYLLFKNSSALLPPPSRYISVNHQKPAIMTMMNLVTVMRKGNPIKALIGTWMQKRKIPKMRSQ